MQKPVKWLRKHFFSGMLLLFPAIIAVSISFRIAEYVYRLMKFSVGLIPARFGHLPYIDRITPVVTFFVLVVMIWLVGLFAKTWIGKIFRAHVQAVLSAIPVAGPLFRAFRQLLDMTIAAPPRSFSRVVLVNFPSRGGKMLGFITGDASEKLTRPSGAESPGEYYKVYIPGTPNPATGFLVFIPKKDVMMTDLTVEEGLLRVMSGGILKQAAGIGGKKTEEQDAR